MKLNKAFEEMEQVLNELNEQFSTIKEHEVRVPQIEIDILMATMRKLYESMSFLNKENQKSSKEEIVVQTTEEVEYNTVATHVEEQVVEPEASMVNPKQQEVMEEEEILNYEHVTDHFLEEVSNLEENLQLGIEHTLKEEKKEKQNHNKAPKPSLLLQFEDEIFSVNDSVAQTYKDNSVVNKLSNTRIENLKSAIGINDKFYFINELFKGNSQAYEDVIYTLNNFKRFDDAMQYTSTLKYRYDWNTEAEAYQKLVHFLERKFMEIHA